MDNQSIHAIHEVTREAVKGRFGRRKHLPSNVITRYPRSCEREYLRIMNEHMRMMNNAIASHMPRLRTTLERYSLRADVMGEETSWAGAEIDRVFDEILADFTTRQGLFNIAARMERLSNLTRRLTISEWKRVIGRTLGIDIFEDYYRGMKFQSLFDGWVNRNVGLIKKIPQESLATMRAIVQDGWRSGKTNADIAREIQHAYEVSKSRAEFWARDQMAKLNAEVTRTQQADAGVTMYVWRTVQDIRVRDAHAELDGTRHSWDDPPEVADGRFAHPGEDYQCRCVALPVFDIDTVALPWEKKGDD